METTSQSEAFCSTYTVSRDCGISIRQLYYWELIGIISPQYESFGTRRFRRYTGGDLRVLKQVKAWLDQGFTLQAIRERLTKDAGRKRSALDHPEAEGSL